MPRHKSQRDLANFAQDSYFKDRETDWFSLGQTHSCCPGGQDSLIKPKRQWPMEG
jgi:hypothetical protein